MNLTNNIQRSPVLTRRPRRRGTATPLWMLVIGSVVMATTVLLPAADDAVAGTPGDYPEYPYSATNYDEPFRGQFHFSSQSGWMNDINAPLYYRGTYHLFYQHNPHGLDWGTMHWGHATSPDLLSWTQQPVALEPGVHNATLFSGTGWVDDRNVTGLKAGDDDPILLFTNTDGVSIAYSTDGARTFQMWNGGAKVISTGFESRDPKVYWDDARGRWGMALWANDGGNTVKFYSSTNLLDWTARGEYRAEWFYECPDLVPLPLDGNGGDRRWVLTDASGQYVVGSLDGNGVFVSDWASPRRMEEGATSFTGTWYAPSTFDRLPDGRVVQMGWQPGNRGSTWTGNASFPVELKLRTFPDGIRVTRTPIAEIDRIRFGTSTWGTRQVTTDPGTNPFVGFSADTYEIEAEFDIRGATASEFGFRLHRRDDGSSDRTVAYDINRQTLYGRSLPAEDRRVTVRLLVDRGQLEVFGNDGRLVVSDSVAFDSSPASQGIELYAAGGSVTLSRLAFHRLNKTWQPAGGGSGGSGGAGLVRWQGDGGKCLDHDTANGRAQIYDCLGWSNQVWTYGSDLSLRNEGLCLDQPGNQPGNGTLVNLYTCNGGANQQWSRTSSGAFRNQWSGRCLDLDSGNATNQRHLQVWDCNAYVNQQWNGPA